MPSGFGELTDQAHDLVSAGDFAGAQRLLADALTGADPRPANATPELAEAAGLHARVLVALGEPHSARAWAAYAYAAATQLHGRSDPRTVAAAATLAAVLHRVGSWSRAARLYQEVIIELTASDGPESLRVLAAHADLATVEYARGQCQVARDRLQDAWELHREVYGDGHPSGIKMLARLGSMQRDCGQFGEAHDTLSLARELCRQHLAPDDPLAAQVAALARAAANPEHVCSETPPVGARGPAVPAARIPPSDASSTPHWPDPPLSDPTMTDPDGPAATNTTDPQQTADPAATNASDPHETSGTAGASGMGPGWSDQDESELAESGLPWPDTEPGWPAEPSPGWPVEPEPGLADPGTAGSRDPAAEHYPAANAKQYPAASQHPPPGQHSAGERHPVEGYHPSQGHPATGHAGAASPVPTPRQPVDGPAGPPEDWWASPPLHQPGAGDTGWPATDQPEPDPYPTGEPEFDPYPDRSELGPYATDQASAGGPGPYPGEPGPDPYPTGAATPSYPEPSTTLPPSVADLTGLTPQASGVYRLRRVAEPEQPGPPSRLLPVPVRRAPVPPRRPNRLVLIVAAGVVVVLLGTAAVIAGVSRVDGTGGSAPTASDAPTSTPVATTPGPAPASPGAPPSGLALKDNRDSVTLSWKYPAGSEGPVIVSGGRSGQAPSPFADLPAGTESFVVYSLDRRLDYCFTVAVAWSTETVARSGEVCTKRR
ncbi:hypothetical protein Vqi01_45830 [Micromonospora qiuiae]|uniref:Tetratricopeptide repeat protein n=1 Tax=Micromonospora qiuiae TaxID=502268 RepID=A0ABQ4JGD9_9ACTN|nr:tetratricopeptide repeat protein [Micromonospora qiuiae]GIJ29421.1 hypothetical protein Vqi01_45830 [Micromonospora qiuiae]